MQNKVCYPMINAKDILFGYVKNYDGLRVHYTDIKSKYTWKVLNYFIDLGEILGFHTVLEQYNRSDLIWDDGYKSEFQSVLHLETENEHGTARNLKHTIPKLKNSEARIKIAIVYTEDGMLNEEIEIYKKMLQEWHLSDRSEVMIIVSDWLGDEMELYNNENHSLVALYKSSNKNEISEIRGFNWKVNENGYMYISTQERD